jgi:16S rRNA processing protein RimM
VAEPGEERAAPGGTTPEHLVVGQVSKVHGTRGEVFIWPLTERPEDVFAAGRRLLLGDEDGGLPGEATTLEVERSRPFKRGFLVKLAGLETREDVEELGRRYLLLPAAELAPLEEGEVFYHQLLGLTVVTEAGEVVGRVREVFETEPAHLLEVKSEAGKVHLIPFAERLIADLDVARGRLVIRPPPGLLEL